MPVLCARPPGIGWLRLAVGQPVRPLAREHATILHHIGNWFAALSLEAPAIVIDAEDMHPLIQGDSVALTVLALAAQALLGLPDPVDLRTALTGSWTVGAGLSPVAPETLSDKAQAALRWGYRRVVVVEGQDGLEAIQENGLEVISVPAHPAFAMAELIRLLWSAHDLDPQVGARALLLIDLALIRGRPDHRLSQHTLERWTAGFADHPHPLVRGLCDDVLARWHVHRGHTDVAMRHDTAAQHCLAQSDILPGGWAGLYILYHRPAHRAIIALDSCQWCEQAPAWLTVERVIKSIIDNRVPEYAFAALACDNTLAQRDLYVGRYERNPERIEGSWQRFCRHVRRWPAIFARTKELGLRDSPLERQHNYLITACLSWRDLCGQRPDWQWPDDGPYVADPAIWQANTVRTWAAAGRWFDLVALVSWWDLEGITVAPGVIDAMLDTVVGHLTFPGFLIPQQLISSGLATGLQRDHAARLLAEATEIFPHDAPQREDASILTLLAQRAAQVLDHAGHPHRPPLHPPPASPWTVFYQTLGADVHHGIARCPY